MKEFIRGKFEDVVIAAIYKILMASGYTPDEGEQILRWAADDIRKYKEANDDLLRQLEAFENGLMN